MSVTTPDRESKRKSPSTEKTADRQRAGWTLTQWGIAATLVSVAFAIGLELQHQAGAQALTGATAAEAKIIANHADGAVAEVRGDVKQIDERTKLILQILQQIQSRSQR